MADAAVLTDSRCTIPNEASRMQQSLESAQSALQSSSIPAQMFGTEMLLDIAKSTLGKRLIVSQGTISVLCGGIADGRIKDQAFTDCLRVLEAVAAYGGAECESGQECGMPADCVDVMIFIFSSSSTQPQEYRLQAGHIAASLLNSHKCQRKALREGSGFDSLNIQLRGDKEDKAFIHQSLEILAKAVRTDGHSKAALAERPDILQSVSELLAYDQGWGIFTERGQRHLWGVLMAYSALNGDGGAHLLRAWHACAGVRNVAADACVYKSIRSMTVPTYEMWPDADGAFGAESCGSILALQMAHSALNAVVAFLCCKPGPGMHELSRQCCAALCQAGIAQPLVAMLTSGPDGHRAGMHKLSRQCCVALCHAGIAQPLVNLLTSEPDGHRYTQVLEIARRLASSGPQGLAAMREAGLLQACLFIISSAAAGSHNAKCAVNLVGRSAEWDESSRRLLKEKEAYLILLEALHVADFEELPLKHDICEVLSKLGSSDPDTSSTGGKLLLHWAAQYGHAELCKKILESNPLPDLQDERGNTPLHLAVCNNRRDAVELLLSMNANIAIANKSKQTPPDLAAPPSDVWELLHEEAQWRSLLQMQRPCRVSLVGWEGPSQFSVCPTLGLLRLHGLSAHIRTSGPSLRRLLRPRSAGQFPRDRTVVSVPFHHTAIVTQPRDLEVHVNFNGLDPVLGQTLVPSSGDGRVTVLELWLATDSAAEAADVEKALTRLQLRSYPDILALSQAFMTYSQMYEQCKADQIEACSQYTKMYLAVQEGHASPELCQQLERLQKEVQDGRDAVIDTHRELLDSASAAIARLVTMRVECEKAWQSAAAEPLWDALGDRASGAMHIVRAYNERFLQSAYSGLLPPQPHHPSDDSEGPAGADGMDQFLNGCAVPKESRSPPIIRTDKELIIAAKALSAQCTEALTEAQAQGCSNRLPVHTSESKSRIDFWPQASSKAGSPSMGRVGADPGLDGGFSETLGAPTPQQKAQKWAKRDESSGSPSEDNLSMTGLIDSDEGASNIAHSSKGSRTSSADTEASLHSASDNSEEHRRHVQRFIRAAPILAAAAMAMQADDDDDDESLNIQPERRSNSSAAQQRPSDKPGKPSKSPVARQLRPEAPSAAQSIPAVPVTGSAESLHTQELVRTARAAATPRASRNWQEDFEMGPGEPCLPFHRRPTSGAEQDRRRSGSFTFPRTPPRRDSESSAFSFRRATASEPCEAIGFPRLARHHPSPLSHHASLTKMGSLEERAGKEVLPDAEHLRMLLDTSASSQWMADTMHANMAEVMEHHMGALDPGEDGLAQLKALLGSDDWGSPGMSSAQAALAQASSAIVPALRSDSVSSTGRPPLPRHARAAATAMPSAISPKSVAPLDTRCVGGPQPDAEARARPATPDPLDSGDRSELSNDTQSAPWSALPNVRTQEARPALGEGPFGGSTIAPANRLLTDEGKAEFVKTLTARIAEAAQKVALGAISSSVDVAGEAVKELPSWAGPDVIIAATMSKLDTIVAAASAEVASAIESGVAQAAALATSMSADELANKLHERKQSVLPSSPTVTPRSPAGHVHGSPAAVKGPISARFPSFAEHGRKALAAARVSEEAENAPDIAVKVAGLSAESEDMQRAQSADMYLGESESAAPVKEDGLMTDAASAPDAELESDASTSSHDARLQSPAKKAKQVFPGPQRPQAAELPITSTQDLVPMMMDPFGQAAMAAMAMQTGTFDAGVCSSAGSMGKVSPRRKKERGRTLHGRSRKMSAGDSFSAISTGASSMSSGHLAAVGQQFESALLDSNCSGLSE